MKLKNLIFISSIFVFILLISFNVDAVTVYCSDPYGEIDWDFLCDSTLFTDCASNYYCVTKDTLGQPVCRLSGYYTSVGSTIDDKLAFCWVGGWLDVDWYDGILARADRIPPSVEKYYVRCGETPGVCLDSVGEYPADNFVTEFCGDDVGEYFINKTIMQECDEMILSWTGCCDNPTDCVDTNSNCLPSSDTFCQTYCYNDCDQDFYYDELCGDWADDCDDNNPNIHPGATELCNNLDDDCNGLIDEDPSFDVDSDGYTYCDFPIPDCNDNNPNIYPYAVEICGNSIDENCNGMADDPCPPPIPYCNFTSGSLVTISSLCNSTTLNCEQGDQITATAFFNVPQEGCTADLKIIAFGEDCLIAPSGGNINGMTFIPQVYFPLMEGALRVNQRYTGTWTIPSIPATCLGKAIDAKIAQLWQSGFKVSEKTAKGSFTFTSCGNNICDTSLGEDYNNCPQDCTQTCTEDCSSDGFCNPNCGIYPCPSDPDCGIPGACTLTDAYWSNDGTADDVENTILPNNSLVYLVVLGTGCDGQEINFTIWEDDPTDKGINNDLSTDILSSGKAIQQWTTEYIEDGIFQDLPEFYFIGEIVGDSLSIQSGLIQVNTSEPTILQQCEDLNCNAQQECCEDPNTGALYCAPLGTCTDPPGEVTECGPAPLACCPITFLCSEDWIGGLCGSSESCCPGLCFIESDGTRTVLTYGDCVDEDGDGYGIRDETTKIIDLETETVLDSTIEQRECTVITEVAVSFFTWTNLLIVIIIIAAYYAYITTRKKKGK